ncbi:hypothetical protein pb186bvf_010311 [Paramecium bursaria]
MKLRLHSELKKDQILLGLEHLRKHTKFFSKFNKKQLEAFEAHFKFISFKEKQQLTKRGEPVDYLGFIIKGSAQTLIENVQKQILEEGDCIGFMACLKMQGAEIQQCDIFAKEDGYLAFIKLDDIRLLAKRDSQFTSFIFMQLSLLALDYVSNQFLGKEYIQHNQQQILETASKKIITMLDNLGVVEVVDPKKKKKQIDENDIKTFRHFWNELEQKEKRLFVQYSNLVEINTSEIVARQHDNTNSFYIILQGELVEFKDKTAGKIYKVGEIIGIKEYLTGQSYSSNIYGRGKCLALKISQSGIQDMIEISGSSVLQIVSMLTRFEAYQLRKQFENQFPDLILNFKSKIENEVEQLKAINKPLTKKEQFTTSQLTNNYFEINVQKIAKNNQNPDIEQEVIAPLYLLDIYKNLVSKRGYQPNEIKDRKDPMFETGLSIFLRDKAHEQRAELLRQKKLQKQSKGKQIQKEDDELENIPIDPFEQLNNDYYNVLLENEKLHDLVFLLEERIKEMNEQHKQNKEELQKMQTQIRKNELHKELLSLDLARQILMPADKTQRKKTTLYDNYHLQIVENKKFKRTVVAAERILTLSQVIK